MNDGRSGETPRRIETEITDYPQAECFRVRADYYWRASGQGFLTV